MIDLSSISRTSPLGQLLRAPLALMPRRAVVRVVAGPLRGMRWRAGSLTHGCWLGSYELAKQRAILARARPGMVFFDIGANAGFYSLLLARAVGPEGRVYAFEPFPVNVLNLLDHVRWNAVQNCTIVPMALSSREGVAPFDAGVSNSMGKLTDGPSHLHVPTLTMDVAIEQIGSKQPDLVKMDVEGAEASVLIGARRLLASRRAVWSIALHGVEQQRRCQEILQDFGYSLETLHGEPIRRPLAGSTIDEIMAIPGSPGG